MKQLSVRCLATVFACAITIFAGGRPAQAATVYVDITNTSGTYNGTSWANAYTSLWQAFDTEVGGDEFWVANGAYITKTAALALTNENNDIVYGGFAGNETMLSQRNWTTNETIITGDRDGDGDSDMTGAQSLYFPSRIGAGAIQTAGYVTLDGLVFEKGFASVGANAGAIYAEKSAPLRVRNSVFRYNQVSHAAASALFCGDNAQMTTYLENCLFHNNTNTTATSGYFGTASMRRSARLEIINCTFMNNFGNGTSGGKTGRDVWGSPSGAAGAPKGVYIYNSILYSDSNPFNNESYHVVSNSVVKDQTITLNDPQFNLTTMSPGFVNAAGFNFRLDAGSPAEDAGNGYWSTETLDLDYTARTEGGGIDMGAYETAASALPMLEPDNVSATDNIWIDRVRITWDAVTGPPAASGYSIFRNTINDSNTATEVANVVGNSTVTYDDLTVVAGNTYYYWLKATNTLVTSAFSQTDSGSAANPPNVLTVAPTGVRASDGTHLGQIDVSWNESYAAVGYNVWRDTDDNPAGAVFLANTSSTNYTDSSAGALASTYDNPVYYFIQGTNANASPGPFSTGDRGHVHDPLSPYVWYQFTNQAVSVVSDDSWHGHNGSLGVAVTNDYTGPTLAGNAVTLRAADFSGLQTIQNAITSVDGVPISSTNGTIVFWVRPETNPGRYYMFDMANNLLQLAKNASGVYGYVRSGDSGPPPYASTPTVATWTHVAYTWSASMGRIVWYNAVSNASLNAYSATATTPGFQTMYLGHDFGGPADRALDGRMADFAYFGYELTATQIYDVVNYGVQSVWPNATTTTSSSSTSSSSSSTSTTSTSTTSTSTTTTTSSTALAGLPATSVIKFN